MKNLIVFYDEQNELRTQLEEIPIPADLRPFEVLIKVEAAGSNPKDWKHPLPLYFNNKINQGDDCAGTVVAVGKDVKSFVAGDRVAGFHEMDTLNGTYAEYAVCPYQTVFRIPESLSFEEAATMPLTIFTAAVGLYRNLDIPAPWDRADDKAASTEKVALVVNAASSAVGAFAVKLAKLNPRIGPIIATAGASADYVRSLGVDAVVDYRSDTVAADIKKAANGVPIRHAFDAANTLRSVKYLTEVLEKGGRYTCTTPVVANKIWNQDGSMEKALQAAGLYYEMIWCGDVHESKKSGGILFGAIMSQAIERALVEGKMSGQPFEVVKGGLDGVLDVLKELKDRNLKRSGNAKFVTRIGETAALQK